MWLFTTIGFFSVVADKHQPADKLAVRARARKHIEAFIAGGVAKKRDIIVTPDADYRFRVVLDRAVVLERIARLTEAVNYGNFKNAARAAMPKKKATGYERMPGAPLADSVDYQYDRALHQTWHTMLQVQREQDGLDREHARKEAR